jgi:hypothetical protein
MDVEIVTVVRYLSELQMSLNTVGGLVFVLPV